MKWHLRYWLLRLRDVIRRDSLKGGIPMDTVMAGYRRDPKKRRRLAEARRRMGFDQSPRNS